MRWKEIMAETASAGASAAGGVATVAQPLGGMQRRSGVYTNHTVVGPDGRAWNTQPNKKKNKKQKKTVNEAPEEEHPLDALRSEVEHMGRTIDELALGDLDEFWFGLRAANVIGPEDKEKYMDMSPKQLEQAFTEYHGISSKDLVKAKKDEQKKHFKGLPKHTRDNIQHLADKMDASPTAILQELESFQYYVKSPKVVVVFDPDGYYPAVSFPKSEEDWLESAFVRKVKKPTKKKMGAFGGYD